MRFSYVVILSLHLVLFIACGGNNSGSGTTGTASNICFSSMSDNPCFDPNVGGTTTIVTDKSTQEVISEQESKTDFKNELEIEDILSTKGCIRTSSLSQKCSHAWEESELVIKSEGDWNDFRASCIFSHFSLPSVDFLNRIVIVSTQNAGSVDIFGAGTEVSAVLEFDSKVVVIISDRETNLAIPCPGFVTLYDIVSVSREDLPVDFIRVKNFKAVP